jgi:hypothetical protein
LNIIPFSGTAVFNSGGFFYLQFASGGANGVALPNPPFTSGSTSYATSTINMSATGGKLALVSSTSGLQTVICPTPTAGAVLDFVGYGSANCSEGNNNNTTAAALPATPSTQSMKRTNFVDTNNNLNDFSTNTTPLPIELLDFQVYQKESRVVLMWVTAREQDNHEFVIERSTDGKEYKDIATIDGQGTSAVIQNYEYTDANPFSGTNYYRLRQVDIDGTIDYSPVRSIKISMGGRLSVAPNPAAVRSGSNPVLRINPRRRCTGFGVQYFGVVGS